MLLIKLDNDTKSMLKESLLKKECVSLYNDLKNKKYHVFYQFSLDDSSLLYEAIEKKEPYGYISLRVSSDKELTTLNSNELNDESKVLAYYIHEKESNLTEEELKNIYQKDFDKLSSIYLLNKEDALQKKLQISRLQKLSKELMNISSLNTNFTSKLQIQYEIKKENYNDNIYSLKMKTVINNKSYVIKEPSIFISKVVNNQKGFLHNGEISITLDNLNEEDKNLFLYLYKLPLLEEKNNKDSGNTFVLNEESFIDLLFLLKGREIEYYNAKCRISNDISSLSLSLLSDGAFKLTPEIDGDIIVSKNNAICFDKSKRVIYLFSIQNEKESILIKFISENKDFRYDLFKDEISSNILPLLNDEKIEISEDFKDKHPIKKYEIRYYVTYEENDSLEFKTLFYLDDLNVSEAEFKSTQIGENKLDSFISGLAFLDIPMNGTFKSQDRILQFLKMDLFPIQKCCHIYLSDNIKSKKVKGFGKLNIHVKSNIDWFEFELGSKDYTKEELEMILSAYKEKKKYVKLKDSFISFEEEDSSSFKELVDDFSLESVTTEKLPLYIALKIAGYEQDDVSLTLSKEAKDLFDSIKNYKDNKVEIRDDILSNLRPYQILAVQWLSTLKEHNLCGILADEMGLGKTLETIAFLSLGKESRPILIVCPKSLIYNWENEFKKWDKQQKVFVFDGDKNSRLTLLSQIDDTKKEVFITSYDSLRNDLDEFEKHQFSYFVLDEGQNIANIAAKKTKAVKEIAADHKLVLTGTPIQNSLNDLWSIFDFLMPGYLPSYLNFQKEYGKLTIDDMNKKENLMKKIAPFVLKRTKKEVLTELPDKEEQIVTISMSEAQRKLYDAMMQKTIESLDKNENKIAILAQITRLREICVDPSMFLENFEENSQKLETAKQMIASSIENGHKVIVFSTFVKTLEHLKKMLDEDNIRTDMIIGETKALDRIKISDEFNYDEKHKVILVSLKAGGTGLNLIGGDIVVLLDPWWNVAAENQASDRAHRIGQKRKVTVMKLICKNSIEERVLQLQQMKKELCDVIQSGDDSLNLINTDDLSFLLS